MKLEEILVESAVSNATGKLGSYNIKIKNISIDEEFYTDGKLTVLGTTDTVSIEEIFDNSPISFDYVDTKVVGSDVEVSFGTDPIIEFKQGTDEFRSNDYTSFFHFFGLKPTKTSVVNPGSGNTVNL